MKSKKKISFILSSLVSTSLLFACQSESKDVSIFIYNNDTFVSSLLVALEDALEDKEMTYETHNAQLSQMKQNEKIVEAIDSGKSKILWINPVDRLSASAIIEKANTKDVPIVFFNREPLLEDIKKGLEENPNLYYVGTDPSFEGQTQANMVSELFGSPTSLSSTYDRNGDGVIQIVLIKGEIGHQDTEERSNSCLESLQALGYETEVLSSAYCNWDKDLAKESMLEIYEDYGEQVELVVSNNDDMAVGAIDALLELEVFKEEEDFVQPFPVLGVDGTDIGLDYIRRGLLYGTVKNEGSKQADAILRLTDYILNNREIDSSFPYTINEENNAVYCEGEEITKENID